MQIIYTYKRRRKMKKVKKLISTLICMVLVLGSTMTVQAASNPYPTTQNMDGDAYYEIPCTWFAWQQVYDNLGIALPAWGNAVNWFSNAQSAGYSTGSIPKANSIAVWSGDTYGHVAYVTAVSGGNTFTVNEGGRTDLDHTSSHGVAYGYRLTNAVGQSRPYDPGKTLLGFIYLTGTPTVSLSWSNSDCQYDTTNAYMYIEADTNVSGSFTEAGITVWNEAGGVVGTKSENPGVTGTHLNVWYNLTNELGIVLQPGTNYKYQFHTVFNGKRYESSVMSFRTNGQAANSWTKELSIDNWVYGEVAKTPNATAKYGTVVYTYSTEKNGTYTAEVPKNAGTYYVKATVAAVENQYTGLEAVKEFKIEKATPQYTIPTELIMTYGERLGSIELPDGFEWYDVTELSGPVGERSAEVRYMPEDENNYTSVENIPVTVTVNAKDLSGIKLSGIDKNTDLDKYQIKDGDTVLVKDTDYTISSVTKNDTVTVTVEFIGNYTGSVQTEYSIKDTTVDNGNSNTNSNKDSNNSASDDKKVDKKDNTKESDVDKAPKTGDSNSVAIWVISIMLAGGAIITILNKKRTFR